MSKKIKIITTLVKGGVLDSAVLINKSFIAKGYNSSLIKASNNSRDISDKINYGDYVIFHMSAYGYQKKGIPFWLINEIKLIKKKSSFLIIHFHELNVNKKFWELGFLIMILQKYINIQLLKYCDLWVTSNAQYAHWLNKYHHQEKKYICPVHSNIDYNLLKTKKDKKIVVIFGTAETRLQIYKKHFSLIKRWIFENKLFLYDIGPKIEELEIKKLFNSCDRVKILGRLSEKKIRDLFSKAYFGIFSKPDDLVDKSGTFATYSKFKVCPINLENINYKKNFSVSNKLRYLSFLPKKKFSQKSVNKICKINFKMSKKYNVENYLRVYIKNFN